MKHAFGQAVTFLYVQNLEQSLHFYQTTLGLETALVQDGCIILKIDRHNAAFLGLCNCTESRSTAGMILTLVSEDLRVIHSQLIAGGYSPDGPPRYNERFDITQFFVNDPDGHHDEVQTFHDSKWPQPVR
ncbi:MAG: VOC family protein [Myxococcota bacterium]|nr:VOC family protein [Myxococcota bacterium]